MAFAPVFGRPFAPTFGRHAAAGNGLLNNLVAYWKMDESSGDAIDAHTSGLTMTLSAGAGWESATGKIGTSRERYHGYLSRNDGLGTGDVDFTIAAWVYMRSLGNAAIFSKYTLAGNQREYLLYYNHNDHAPNQRMAFAVSADGASHAIVDATDFGAISRDAWYLVIGWHDAANNQIGVAVNNVATVIAHNAGVYGSSAVAYLGVIDEIVYGIAGRLDEISFWKSSAGAGGVLTAAQRTALYNAGAGLAYSAFTT